MSAHPDLDHWLHTTTRHLSPGDRAAVAQEIEAHYEFAYQRARRRGISEGEAHHAAMNELGDVRSAKRQMTDSYAPGRRFLAAFFVSLLFPLTMALVWNVESPLVNIVRGVVLLVAMVYALRSFTVLLETRHSFEDFSSLMFLLRVALLFGLGFSSAVAILFTLYGRGGYDPTFLRFLLLIMWLINVTFAVTLIAFGARLLRIAGRGLPLTLLALVHLLSGMLDLADIGMGILAGLRQVHVLWVWQELALALLFAAWAFVFWGARQRRARAV